MAHRYGKKTQKRRGASKKASKEPKESGTIMTIPELRKSMDYISNYAQELLAKGKSTSTSAAEAFQKEWKAVFGKSLDFKTAKSYIEHVKRMTKVQLGKKTRKLRGGMAPLAYQMGPGTDIPYGKFLPYVNSGFWNPEPAILADCGKQTGILPPPGMGSNKMNGGGFLEALGIRPFLATNPPSIQHSAMMDWKGMPSGPGSEAWQQTWKPIMPGTGVPSIPVAAPITRTLSSDVTSSNPAV